MDKVSINVICKSTGKKYKMSFSKSLIDLISTKHIVEHMKKILPNVKNFDLFLNGQQLQQQDLVAEAVNSNIYLVINSEFEQNSEDDYEQIDNFQQIPEYKAKNFDENLTEQSRISDVYTSQKVQQIRHLSKQLSSKLGQEKQSILEKSAQDVLQLSMTSKDCLKTKNDDIKAQNNNNIDKNDQYNVREIIVSNRCITPKIKSKVVVNKEIESQAQLEQDNSNLQQINALKHEISSLKLQLEINKHQEEQDTTEKIYKIVNEKIRQATELSKSKISSSQLRSTMQKSLTLSMDSDNQQQDDLILNEVTQTRTKITTQTKNSKNSTIQLSKYQNEQIQLSQFEQLRIQDENKQLEQDIIQLIESLTLNSYKQDIFNQDYENTKQQLTSIQGDVKELKVRSQQLQLKQKDVFEWNFCAAQLKQVSSDLQKQKDDLCFTSIERKKLHNLLEDLKGNIRVFVRLRPLLDGEIYQNNISSLGLKIEEYINITTQQQIALNLPYSLPQFNQQQLFNFYRVYNYQTSQKTVFNDIKPLLISAIDGFNITLLCYGSTGSGKTFTLIGDSGQSEIFSDPNDKFSRLGILPRSIVELFALLNAQPREFSVQTAVLELYLDSMIDLIVDEQKELKIRYQNDQYFVQNLNFVTVSTAQQLLQLLGSSLESRHVSSTKCNSKSSRSHAIIYVKITIAGRTSTVIFADLAGSERVEKSQSEGLRFKEAQYINQSLSSLGDVVGALSNKNQHIPFRNNKLTQILQPGLGGNSKALLFVNLSPLYQNLQESYSSLTFGTRAKAVQNVAVKGLFE